MHILRSDPLWLVVGCCVLGIGFLLLSIRWSLLLRVQRICMPFRAVAALTLIGQFFNSFLLGAAGGDLVRALYVAKLNKGKTTMGMVSIVVDRAVGLLVLLCLALGPVLWNYSHLTQRSEIRSITFVLVLVLCASIAGMILFWVAPKLQLPDFVRTLWLRVPYRRIMEIAAQALHAHGTARRLTVLAIVISVPIQVCVFTLGYCIARAIHLEATFGQLVVILAVVICAISLPISVGGHGVREGMFILMFSAFGIANVDPTTGAGKEPALLFSVLFFAMYLVWSLIGGIVYVVFRHAGRIEAVTPAARAIGA